MRSLYILLLLLPVHCSAAPAFRMLTSVAYSEMTNAIATFNAGDVVYVPVSTNEYTLNLEITNALNFISEGAEIQDSASLNNVLRFNSRAVHGLSIPSRFSGFRIVHGNRTNDQDNGCILIDGGSSSNTDTNWWVRFDHNYVYNLYGNAFTTLDAFGVADHNNVFVRQNEQFVYHRNARFNGGDYGDGSWAAPLDIASDRRWIWEDNTFSKVNPSGNGWATDGSSGCRFLFRYNTVNHCLIIEHHGTDSGGRRRGGVTIIVYGNTFIGNNSDTIVGNARSGNILWASNTISGYNGVTRVSLDYHRLHHFFGNTNFWGGADGKNLWDVNYAGGPFTTGTVATTGTRTFSVSGTPWTSSNWWTYSVIRTSGPQTPSGTNILFGFITTNTSSSLYWAPNSFGSDCAFQIGDTFEIRRVQHGIDMLGRRGGSLLSGATPSIPGGWNDQITQLCYSWQNIITDAGGVNMRLQASSSDGSMVEGVHFTNEIAMPGFSTFPYPHPRNAETQSIGTTPSITNVLTGVQVDFDMIGGNGTNLIWHVWVNNSGATINSTNGLYTAGPSPNVTDTVRVWDTYGNYKNTLVTVSAAATTVPGGAPNKRPRRL